MNTLDLIAKHNIDIYWFKDVVRICLLKPDFYALDKPHNGTDEDKARALREAIEEITG